MLYDLITIKDRIGNLLEVYSELRDSDKKLWLAYLNRYHGLRDRVNSAKSPYEALRNIFLSDDTPSFESIRRVRQKYQEAGLFVGENRKERLNESKKVREW